MTLGSQFVQKINKQFIPMRKQGAEEIAKGIVEQMKQNVDRGVGFDPDQSKYKQSYAQETIRKRRKGNYQVEFADLQRRQKRVKSAKVFSNSIRSTISFARGGSIMFYHQWGLGNNPRRQLFPDVVGGGQNQPGNGELQYTNSMPVQIVRSAHRLGAKLMNRPV